MLPNNKARIERPASGGRSADRSASELALRTLGIVILVGLTVPLFYSLQAKDLRQYVSIATTGIVVAGASLLIGSLLGFLFGIPRTLQQERTVRTTASSEQTEQKGEPQARSQSVDYQANTNLEQISDWLTKILVGVGLTQLSTIPGKLQQLAAAFAIRTDESADTQPFTLGIILFFLICGFLFGFLWTRLYLPGAFRRADLSALADIVETNREAVEQVTEKVQELKNQMELDAKALALVQSQLNPSGDTTRPSQGDLSEAIGAASRLTKILVFNQAQAERMENWKDNKARMELVIPIFRALIVSDTEKIYHRNHGQLGYALKDKPVPAWSDSERELTEAINMRGPWEGSGYLLYEFNRAICRIRQDEDFKNGRPSQPDVRAGILADLSAAYKGGRKKPVKDTPEVKAWLSQNGLSFDDLA